MSLRLNERETIRLLKLYQMEPVLYNSNHADYHDRNERAAAAERICEKLNVPGFGSKEVIVKFKNLRNSYCQELKKISDSERSGAAADSIYKPIVFWFDKMSFIRPFIKQREKQSSLQVPEIKTNVSHEYETEQKDILVCEPITIVDTILSTSNSRDQKRKASHLTQSKERPTAREELTYMSTVMGKLDNITEKAKELIGKQDCYEHFGRYVSSMLRTIGPPDAFMIQKDITEMLTTHMCSSSRDFAVTPSGSDTTSIDDTFSDN